MSFDEHPDGDIHGERAAESEMSELSAFEKWWAMLSKVPYMSKKEIAERAFYAGETASHELRFDACRPYLKEGETPAECLARNRADIVRLMGKWGAEKMRSAKLRDDLDKIAQTTGSDDPCRPYLKEGETAADALNRMQKEVTTLRNAAMQLWADRRTFDKGNDMNLGDLFDKRDKQAEEDRKDAARYRWLRDNLRWLTFYSHYRPDQIDAAIDKARAAKEAAG